MSLVNHERKFVYVFEPHTASRATELALLQLDGSQTIGNRHAGVRELIEGKYITKEQASKYRIVCTVRNPLDTFITRWKIRKERRIETMVNDIQNGSTSLHGLGLWSSATDVVWYEYLDEDMQSLFGVTMPEIDPTHKSKYKKERWQAYYTNINLEGFSLITEACRPYMNKFGYRPFTIGEKVGVAVDKHLRQHIFNVRKPI